MKREVRTFFSITLIQFLALSNFLNAQPTIATPAGNGDPAEYDFYSPVNLPAAVFYDFDDGYFSTTTQTTFKHYFQKNNLTKPIEPKAHKKDPYTVWGPPTLVMPGNIPAASPTPAPNVLMNRNVKITRAMLNSINGENVYVVTIANTTSSTNIDGRLKFTITPEVSIIGEKDHGNGLLFQPVLNSQEREWDFYSLKPGETRNFFIYTASNNYPSGTAIIATASINSPAQSNFHDEVSERTLMAGGPFDPNIIGVNRDCIKDNYPLEQRLVYHVRFQNIGSEEANNVYVSVRLPQNIDTSSVFKLYSTHSCNWQVVGHTLIVEFLGINLPGTNQPQGANVLPFNDTEGWFSYSVCALPNLPDGEILDSDATIVFDTQLPINTNTAETISKFDCQDTIDHCQDFIVVDDDYNNQNNNDDDGDASTRSEGSLEKYITISPNPVTDLLTLKINKEDQSDKRMVIYDSAGRLVLSKKLDKMESQFKIDVSQLERGIYYYRITSINKINSGKFIKI